MTNQKTSFRRAEAMHDVLLVSSFGLWAVVLGLLPVFAFSQLMGS